MLRSKNKKKQVWFSYQKIIILFFAITFLSTLFCPVLSAQASRWLNVGSLHNWYSEIGNEREHGLVSSQQYGLRWPGILEYQDAQSGKSLWIGVRNFQDDINPGFDYKVIHAGPRVLGSQSFFPRELTLISRYPQTEVLVDGTVSAFPDYQNVKPDSVDPALPSDRMIRNRLDTELGISFTRNIHQFSQGHHDNYHILEYVFVNDTGLYRDIPEQVLDSVYFYFSYRYAPVRKSRYMIANHTGWGRNTMNDRWGDGLHGQAVGEPFSADGPHMRASYAWHGSEPDRRVDFNNIGAPQISPVDQFMTPADTLGHLIAPHFVGHATIHADTSPDNRTDNLQQPGTRGHVNSDDVLKSGNDPLNRVRMEREYEHISRGVMPRHAWQVHTEANEFLDFADQTRDPRLGTSGGMSAMKAYGPYTLHPGDTIRIVMAEGASGISRQKAEKIGSLFKEYVNGNTSAAEGPRIDGTIGTIDTRAKNEWVLTGRDSLLQSFERAIANYLSGYAIPHPPASPSRFEVTPGDEEIELTWDYDADESRVSRFEIYRARGSFENHHKLTAVVDPSERVYVDRRLRSEETYFYYISAVGHEADNTGVGLTPPGALASSRYYTQTYDPAHSTVPTGTGREPLLAGEYQLSQNYPNPFNSATRIGFQLPESSRVRLEVYDITGRLVAVLAEGEHPAGRHQVAFDAGSLASGVYVYRLQAGEFSQSRSMMLVR